MMLTVRITNGDTYRIRELPDADALDLVDDWQNGDDPVLTFQLSPPWWAERWWPEPTVVHLARRHVTGIELNE